jgi:hypothetical protein
MKVHRSQPSSASVIGGVTPTPSHRFRSPKCLSGPTECTEGPMAFRCDQILASSAQPLFAKVGVWNGGVWVEHFRPNELACIALHLN